MDRAYDTSDHGTMSAGVFRSLVLAVAAAGVDVESLILAPLGIARETLDDPEARIPTEIVSAMSVKATELTGDPDFGLHSGERAPLGALGVLDHATRSSRTIGEALERMVRYFAILSDRTEVGLVVEGDVARVTRRPAPPLRGLRYGVDALFAAIVVRARVLTGRDFPLRFVRFTYSRPESTAELDRFFRAPMAFGQPIDELVFDASWLDQPFLTADPSLTIVLDRYADALLAKLAAPADAFLLKVRRAIAEGLRGSDPSLGVTARRVGVSSRTLQRNLQAAGTSHKDLVEEVRRELALHYLDDAQIAISEVAYLLGFSEGSAFHRAFRRWTGQTPGEYRSAVMARSAPKLARPIKM